MATRSQIEFYESKQDLLDNRFCARIYHHWDGYPEGRMQNIKAMLEMANVQYKGSAGFSYRTNVKDEYYPYMSDMAAFYILANKDGAGNVEIDNQLHSDIEYLYQIYPGKKDLRVRILTPRNWKSFWDSPEVSKMKRVDDGTLEKIYKKYQVNQ